MEIKRDYYLKKLIEAKNDGLIKILIGRMEDVGIIES